MRAFLERLKDPKPLLYDGGFATELFRRRIELPNSAVASVSHPDTVVDIHSSYLDAGSDVLGTNTFVASVLHLEMAGKDPSEAAEIVKSSVEHARRAIERAEKGAYVAGVIGPSPGALEADSGDTEFGIPNVKARDAHARVAEALAGAGVDFFVLETMFSAKEAAIAIDSIREIGLPIAVNLTYKYTKDRKTGECVYRTDWGHSAGDLLDILSSGEFSDGDDLLEVVQVLGLNCGAEQTREEHTGMPYAKIGIQQLRDAMKERGINTKRMMCFPNAGIPDLDMKYKVTTYSQTPEVMAPHLPDLLEEGAYFIGGCCGTQPAHIRTFRESLDANWKT